MIRTAELLWNEGVYLVTIEDCGYEVALYLMNEDFYEVYFNSIEKRIERVIHASERDLEKYLNKIDFEKLRKV
jgi:hypothetical protein